MRSAPIAFRLAALFAALATVRVAVSAHHGSVEYRTEKIVILKQAKVTRFLWENPHSLILFDVKDESGNISHWAGEAGSPAAIRPLGWNKNSLRAGEVVTVQLYPSKFESTVGRVDKIVLSDGTILMNSSRTDRGEILRY